MGHKDDGRFEAEGAGLGLGGGFKFGGGYKNGGKAPAL
jgi:hypothetical protein